MFEYETFRGEDYFPAGKRAAIVLTIDDIHPGKSNGIYDEAGGDHEKGALGHLIWLQERHPELKATLFTTADWRQTSAFPRNPQKLLGNIPFLRDRAYLAPLQAKGTMQLDRHPQFVGFLRELYNVDIGWHGLYHVHKGLKVGTEFQDEPVEVHLEKFREMKRIFDAAGLHYVPGICPPTWNASSTFIKALDQFGNRFVASSRDIFSPITEDAICEMSGLKGTSLIHASRVGQQVHFTTNFQGTCPHERAFDVLHAGGILAIKSHIIKYAFGHISLDALDRVYCNYLDVMFRQIKREFGDAIWWTSMAEITEEIHKKIWPREDRSADSMAKPQHRP